MTSTIITKILPKITIPKIHISTCKEEIVDCIRTRNPNIGFLMDNGSILELIFTTDPKDNFYSAILKCSPQIRDAITANNNKIFINTTRHHIFDRFFIRRCELCNVIGHNKHNCKKKLSCRYCGNEHKHTECSVKDNIELHSCHRCKISKRPELISKFKSHDAYSLSCPLYQEAVLKLKANTLSSEIDTSHINIPL